MHPAAPRLALVAGAFVSSIAPVGRVSFAIWLTAVGIVVAKRTAACRADTPRGAFGTRRAAPTIIIACPAAADSICQASAAAAIVAVACQAVLAVVRATRPAAVTVTAASPSRARGFSAAKRGAAAAAATITAIAIAQDKAVASVGVTRCQVLEEGGTRRAIRTCGSVSVAPLCLAAALRATFTPRVKRCRGHVVLVASVCLDFPCAWLLRLGRTTLLPCSPWRKLCSTTTARWRVVSRIYPLLVLPQIRRRWSWRWLG